MTSGAFGPRPLNWPQAMSERVLEKMHVSDEWRRAFVQEVAAMLYERVHTGCEAGCICQDPRGVLHGRLAS